MRLSTTYGATALLAVALSAPVALTAQGQTLRVFPAEDPTAWPEALQPTNRAA